MAFPPVRAGGLRGGPQAAFSRDFSPTASFQRHPATRRGPGDTNRPTPLLLCDLTYCAGLIVLIQSGDVRCQKQELMYGFFSSGKPVQ